MLRLQRELEEGSWPRVQMSLIVALTGAAGLLFSFLLLHAGVEGMALRYPLALVGAYAVFLFLLWLWLRTQASDYGDVPDPTGLLLGQGSGSSELPLPMQAGGGGDFGGGGASASFDGPGVSDAVPTSSSSSSIGDTVGASFDADELAIPLIAIVLAVGLALASLYVVYVAPVLFAELLLDGALSYTLYRRLRAAGGDSPHWFTTALRRTAVPFALTAVFLAIVGLALSAYAPGARSLGEALNRVDAASGGRP